MVLYSPGRTTSYPDDTVDEGIRLHFLGGGDEVGNVGCVTKVTDDFVVLEISNNLEIKLQKQSVQATLPKGTIKSI